MKRIIFIFFSGTLLVLLSQNFFAMQQQPRILALQANDKKTTISLPIETAIQSITIKNFHDDYPQETIIPLPLIKPGVLAHMQHFLNDAQLTQNFSKEPDYHHICQAIRDRLDDHCSLDDLITAFEYLDIEIFRSIDAYIFILQELNAQYHLHAQIIGNTLVANREEMEAAISRLNIPKESRSILAKYWYLFFGHDKNYILPELDYGFSLDELREFDKLPAIAQSDSNHELYLNLSGQRINSLKGLKKIPGIVKLSHLYLGYNHVAKIEPHTFDGLNNLKTLNLGHNMIPELHPGTFSGLNNLEQLELDYNQISRLKPHTFDGCKNLHSLALNSNKLEELQPAIFEDLNNLQMLALENNRLIELSPHTFHGLTNLKELYLGCNKIAQLYSFAFEGLHNLCILKLFGNQLRELKPIIFDGLKELKELWLHHNQITTIHPYVFSGLDKLEELLLYENQISHLDPHAFQGLNNLKKLFLCDNQVTTLPHDVFASLAALRKLWIMHNKIQKLEPDFFDGLVNLDQLWLAGNLVKTDQQQALKTHLTQLRPGIDVSFGRDQKE